MHPGIPLKFTPVTVAVLWIVFCIVLLAVSAEFWPDNGAGKVQSLLLLLALAVPRVLLPQSLASFTAGLSQSARHPRPSPIAD